MTTPIASGRKRTIEEMTKLFKKGQFETSHIFILWIQNYIHYLKQFEPKNRIKNDSHPDGFTTLLDYSMIILILHKVTIF
jgi:hypothetical protein